MGEITGGAMRRLSLGVGAAGGSPTAADIAAITAGEATTGAAAAGGGGEVGKEVEGLEGMSQELLSARVRLTGEKEEVERTKVLLEVRKGEREGAP